MTNRECEAVTQQKTLLESRRSLKRHGDKMFSQGFTGYIFILDERQTWPNWSFAINQEVISRIIILRICYASLSSRCALIDEQKQTKELECNYFLYSELSNLS